MLRELCKEVDKLENGTVSDSDVRMIRGYIDAAMGMLSELNGTNWSEGEPMPAGLVEGLGEHLDSYELECAGRDAKYAANYLREAVLYVQ